MKWVRPLPGHTVVWLVDPYWIPGWMASTHAPAGWLVAVETFGSVHFNESQRGALTQPAPCVVEEHKEKDKDRGLAEVRRERWQEPWDSTDKPLQAGTVSGGRRELSGSPEHVVSAGYTADLSPCAHLGHLSRA